MVGLVHDFDEDFCFCDLEVPALEKRLNYKLSTNRGRQGDIQRGQKRVLEVVEERRMNEGNDYVGGTDKEECKLFIILWIETRFKHGRP